MTAVDIAEPPKTPPSRQAAITPYRAPTLPSRLKKLAYDASTALLAWHYRRNWGMTIGEGVRIARTAKMDKTNPRGVKIGDYTCITFDVAVLTHDFINGVDANVVIGSHSFIGARSVIMPGVTIGDHCIVGPGSVVMTDVPDNCVVFGNPARVVERGIVTGKWGIRNPKFLELEGITSPAAPAAREPPKVVRLTTPAPTPAASAPADLIASYLPGVTDPSKTFDDLGVDSFTLVTLRAEIEENEGSTIPDDAWTEIERPSDLLRFITRPKGAATARTAVAAASVTRRHEITLPQMAMSGLSENWLFREAGDVHWALLAQALGVKTRDIADVSGDRLFPTFSRLRYRASRPLADIRENDILEIVGKASRFGAALYLSEQQMTTGAANIAFEALSGFTKHGETEDNTALKKGQPEIPPGFSIPSLPQLPEFAADYNAARGFEPEQTLFECGYELTPQYDINGVGMLYCAAYPIIADVGLSRYLGPGSALAWSPVERDVCYFGNCRPDDALIWRLHEDIPEQNRRRVVSTLSRASDGRRIALVRALLAARG